MRSAPARRWFDRHLDPHDWYASYATGLVCYLLGIRSSEQLRDHPLRGFVFETWVASEVVKSRLNAGQTPALSFFRDRRGREVDVVEDGGDEPQPRSYAEVVRWTNVHRV